MPDMTVRGVHVNAVLSNLMIGYHPSGTIAEKIVKVVPVRKESDFYYIFNRGDAFRTVDDRRADGTRANKIDFGFTRDSYLAEEYALETSVTDRQRDNADAVLNIELAKTRRVGDIIMLNQEKRVRDLLTTNTNYASTNYVTLSGTSQWNHASYSGSIEKVFDDAKNAVVKQTGAALELVSAVIPFEVAQVIKRDAYVRDVIKYTHNDLLVNGDLPPRLWNLNIVIPTCVENTGVEVYGTDTATMAYVWGNDVVLSVAPQAPGIDILAHAYIFRARDWKVEQWRDETVNANFYRIGVIQAEKVVSNIAGYLIENAIA